MSPTKAIFHVTFPSSFRGSLSEHSQTLPDDGMASLVTSYRRHGRETKPQTEMCCTERKYVRKVEHEECPCASLSGQGLFLFYMFECFTFMYVHVPHVSVFRGVRRGHWGALDLELQMVVSGKQTRVLCKSSQLSQSP